MTPSTLNFVPSRGDERALYVQLKDHLAALIASGVLAAGGRLPSTRTLAADISVHRSTVVEAYRGLREDGLIEQRPGSGTRVLAKPARAEQMPRRGAPVSSAVRGLEHLLSAPASPADEDVEIDLARIAPDERTFPHDEVAESLRRVLAERGGDALAYGSPAGDERLRELLAERLMRRGLRVSAADVLVVSGAQQGLDLVFRAVLDPGERAITEAPTYHMALDLLRLHRADVMGVPLVAGSRPGMGSFDPARLAEAFARRPSLFYTAPAYQNPTGLTLDDASRTLLVRAARDAGALLVEDDYEGDMTYDGPAPPPLAAHAEAGEVAYVGTLSKALFPGLRLGWVVASPSVLSRVALVKRLSDLSGSLLLQAAAADLLASGAYARHLAIVVGEARKRMAALGSTLAAGLPEGGRVTRPLGGHALWVTLPPGLSARAMARRMAARGVAVLAGDAFVPESAAVGEGLRLSISRADVAAVTRGARIVCEVLAEAMAQAGGREGLRRAPMDEPVRV